MSGYVPDPRHLRGDVPDPRFLPPARAARYSRWDGSQQLPDLDADEIMDALADDMMAEGDLASALQRLMERGWRSGDPTRPDMPGLEEMLERLRERREEMLRRGQLNDVLKDIREELQSIVDTERAGIERRMSPSADAARLTDAGRTPGEGGANDDGSEDDAAAGESGLPGEAGESGQAGQAGRPGQTGQRGQSGRQGQSGQPGQSGQSGQRGQAGRSGQRGDAGDGQDDSSAPGAGGDDANEQLDDARLREMLREMARRKLDRLDELPQDVGGRIRALQDYDFMEPAARDQFEALLERLRKQVLDQYFAGLSDAIKDMKPEQLAANRDMVRDLNELLRQKLRGEEPDASEFLSKHGQFFPGAQNLDDIIEQLAERMAAMQSLLRSMSPDQRAQLESMMDALLRDDRLRWDLAQLAANLDQLLPEGLGERFRMRGDDQMGLEPALEQMAQLNSLSSLEESLSGVESPADLGRVDREEVARLLGERSANELDALNDLARRLEQAGYLERDGDRMELTPRGSRKIGQKVLDDLFGRLKRDAFGGHAIDRQGQGGERTDGSKPYEFGDAFHLDLQRTLANAMQRPENSPAARGGAAVKIAAADFEVARTEQLTSSATVLLVDMSRSMLLRGCYVAAKKVALALNTLIRTQYPRDHLSVIGFAYYAREIGPDALAQLSWHGYEYGTNLQHGLMLARRILSKQHAANREIVVITDGEPTAHFENGQVEFSYPPTRRTIQQTLAEVGACTREGITINTFMLERSRALAEFVARLTELNRGRAFYAAPESLGEYVLVDYVSRKTSHRR